MDAFPFPYSITSAIDPFVFFSNKFPRSYLSPTASPTPLLIFASIPASKFTPILKSEKDTFTLSYLFSVLESSPPRKFKLKFAPKYGLTIPVNEVGASSSPNPKLNALKL